MYSVMWKNIALKLRDGLIFENWLEQNREKKIGKTLNVVLIEFAFGI